MNKSFIKKLTLAVALTALSGGIFYYVFFQLPAAVVAQGPIYDYEPARDRKDIVDYFERNLYWLTPSSQSDIEFQLDHKSPNRSPLYFGKLIVKVLREDGKFVGFTAYYRQTLTKAMLLYVGVNEEFQGKGYGRKLVEYILKDLKRRGAHSVWLLTRTNNFSAQKLYNKTDFTETRRTDEGCVYFDKEL